MTRFRYVLRIIGVLCVVYGVGLQISGKSAGMFPFWLSAGAFCFGLSFKKPYGWVFSRKPVKLLLLAVVFAVAVFEGIVVITGYASGPTAACDYIIVLGAKVDGELPSRTLLYRLETAYSYLAAHTDTKAVLSGGRGGNEGISEAESMRRYLSARGIGQDRLIAEDKSTSTYENLRNSFALLGGSRNLKICVVTSDYHILRAKLIALKLGRQVSGIGARTPIPLIPNSFLRELLGVVHDAVLSGS